MIPTLFLRSHSPLQFLADYHALSRAKARLHNPMPWWQKYRSNIQSLPFYGRHCGFTRVEIDPTKRSHFSSPDCSDLSSALLTKFLELAKVQACKLSPKKSNLTRRGQTAAFSCASCTDFSRDCGVLRRPLKLYTIKSVPFERRKAKKGGRGQIPALILRLGVKEGGMCI